MTPPTAPLDVLLTVSFSEDQLAQLRQLSPRLRLTTIPTRTIDEIPAELLSRAEVLYTDRVIPTPTQAPNLKWVQFHFAGIDFALDAPLLAQPDVQFTTLSGAAAPQVAEYTVMMLLALGHRLPDVIASQSKAEWSRNRWERFAPSELRGSTVGILGYGSIGREIARLLHPWGVQLLAVKRDVMNPEDGGYMPAGLGDPSGDYFTRLYPMQAIHSMLKLCDYIVICLPLTAHTRGLINAEALAACKPDAKLVHIGRGGVVDQASLLNALQEKKIAGAALDVFSEEPLPPDSPFWKLQNVIISPHIAGISPFYQDRAVAMFSENLRRYLESAPLLNRFDPVRGY
jgi:phosphoglycerate dehydrogenase-like enzyme